MTPDEILSYPARVLTQEQREAYFDNGFVNLDEIVPADILNIPTGHDTRFCRTKQKRNSK